MVPQLDVHDRRRLVLVQDDDHAVGQHKALVLQLRRAHRRLQRHVPNRHHRGGQKKQDYRESLHFVIRHSFSLFLPAP
ncbi:hypothetical protein D3C83_134760 [compost metagenome]